MVAAHDAAKHCIERRRDSAWSVVIGGTHTHVGSVGADSSNSTADRFGIRPHVVRDTVKEARAAAEKLIEKVTPEIAAAAQTVLAKYESEGQRRMLPLQRNGRDALWLRPDLWVGLGWSAAEQARRWWPTVAALVREYAALGIDTFILSGYSSRSSSGRGPARFR